MTIKAAKGSINVSNGLYQSSTLLWYAKKEKYLHNISTITFTIFSHAYLIWARNLDVLKIGISLSKRT